MPGAQSPLTPYDRQRQQQNIPHKLVPILGVQDGQGGEYDAEMTVNRSTDPADPARAYDADALRQYLLKAPNDKALRVIQRINQKSRMRNSKGTVPKTQYNNVYVPTGPDSDPQHRTIVTPPGQQPYILEQNNSGGLIQPGSGNPVDGALQGWAPDPGQQNLQPAPGATQAPPPPPPGSQSPSTGLPPSSYTNSAF